MVKKIRGIIVFGDPLEVPHNFIPILSASSKSFFVYLLMLLQLENTCQDDINKLLAFARENHLKLSLVDESEVNFLLPGKPLLPEQLTQLIETSRKSGIISMKDAHQIIINSYNAD